ncbi:DUF4381 domain-containing protein [Rubritalea tangerina]|uniref:DUF4381 domain-containing protein n=1 Tax=Rubritalea tangerina TaxID=430798 RepID=A0ABW4ZA10_9BACT
MEWMMATANDLSELRDISMPEVPGILPLAPGAIVLLAIAAWILLCVGWAVYLSYRAKAYRRAGVDLLGEAVTVRDVSVVLKRVAMVSYGRERVASLYGEEWVDFLREGGAEMPEIARCEDSDAEARLRGEAEKWIKKHRC